MISSFHYSKTTEGSSSSPLEPNTLTDSLGTLNSSIPVNRITTTFKNSFFPSQSLRPPLCYPRKNEKTRLRNADEIHLTVAPELWRSESMPLGEDLIYLIFDFLNEDMKKELDGFFPITSQTSDEKISIFYGYIAQIPLAVKKHEFKVTHKHIFYLYQIYHKIKQSFFTNTTLTEVADLILSNIKVAIKSILSELCKTEVIGDKIKMPGLKEIALLVRYANLINWPSEEDSNLLRSMIQQHVFATEVKGADSDLEETWSSVGFILDYIITKCENLDPKETYFQEFKNALARPILSVFEKTGLALIDDSVIINILSRIKEICQKWKIKLDSGQEIQLPMLYHGSKAKEGPPKCTFPQGIFNFNLRNLDESKATLEGAFLSTWPEIGYAPPAASFSILELFRAPSDLTNYFDPQKRRNNLSTIENTRWISFKELVPVPLYDLQSRPQKSTILTLGVSKLNIEIQEREAPHDDLEVMDFDIMRGIAFMLRAFPLLFPKYISGKERVVKRNLSSQGTTLTSVFTPGSSLGNLQPVKRAKI